MKLVLVCDGREKPILASGYLSGRMAQAIFQVPKVLIAPQSSFSRGREIDIHFKADTGAREQIAREYGRSDNFRGLEIRDFDG